MPKIAKTRLSQAGLEALWASRSETSSDCHIAIAPTDREH